MKAISKIKTIQLRWIILGTILVACGFAVDGSTEIGHHAFLIVGGMAVGASLKGNK